MATELTPDALAALRTTHAQDRMAPVLTRAITKNGIEAASFDNQAASRLARTFLLNYQRVRSVIRSTAVVAGSFHY